MTAQHHHVWQDDALCAGLDQRMFFPEPGDSTKEAVAICAQCPVQAECLNYALENGERFGIYGGTTARQRKDIRRTRTPRKRQPTHGTPAGYDWHRARKQAPCWACADANSRWEEVATRLRQEGRT